MSKYKIKDRCNQCNSVYERMITPVEKELNIKVLRNGVCDDCLKNSMAAMQNAYYTR